MRIRPRRQLPSTTLAAYLEGEVTASEAVQIETRLEGDAEGRRRLEQLRRIRDALSASTPELDDLDLIAGVREKALLPVPQRPRRMWWFAGAMTMLVGLTVVLTSAVQDQNSGFRAKIAGTRDLERWSGIQVYRVSATGTPEPDPERIDIDDGLLFSYSNLGSQPFDHLMIVAVGADGGILWFYPAYDRQGTNPSSIEIAKDQSRALLGEVIHHDFQPGVLSICGLFTRRPLNVVEVESWLRQPGDHETFPGAQASIHWITTEVAP